MINQINISELNMFFNSSKPKHVVIDDFLEPSFASAIESEIKELPLDGATVYKHFNEDKYGLSKVSIIPKNTVKLLTYLNSPEFIKFVESLTGFNNLISDDTLNGGGIHITKRHGFLQPHLDFRAHPRNKNWLRRLNLIIYLNKDWSNSYNGHLKFYSPDSLKPLVSVAPIFNRCVLFETSEISIHGYPEPLDCPDNVLRLSLALFYYSIEDHIIHRPTKYFLLPTDNLLTKVSKKIDNYFLNVYHYLRYYGVLSDKNISYLINLFRSKK